MQPVHVAAYVEELQERFAPPTVKQHLAAMRMLFDWLVDRPGARDQPGACGARPEIRRASRGKTPVLNADEARALLDASTPTR